MSGERAQLPMDLGPGAAPAPKHGTAIEWTHPPGYKGETWNPTTGCDRVSPGCAHCYAADLAAKLKGWGQPRYQRDGGKASGPGFGLTLHPDKLEDPLRWKKPRAVFVNSMSDLFHEEVPDDFIAHVFATMAATPRHLYMVLTKRPERMAKLLGGAWIQNEVDDLSMEHRSTYSDAPAWPLPNVWLGTSIENRRFVGRADELRRAPAAVRFISAEPLLGPLIYDAPQRRDATQHVEARARLGTCWVDGYLGPGLNLTDIDWLIVGGESGPKARPLDLQWMRDLREAALVPCPRCDGYGGREVPEGSSSGATTSIERTETLWCQDCGFRGHRTAFFVKQLGGRRPGGALTDLPEDLRIREYPALPLRRRL